MSVENWKIKGLCRCCHAEGTFRDLAEPCFDFGPTEVYIDMLKESFDISLAPVAGVLCTVTYTICEGCITRLRDASVFKQQVLVCEQRFQELYMKSVKGIGSVTVTVENTDVKQELPETYPEDFKEDFSHLDDDDTYDVKLEDDKTLSELKSEDMKRTKAKGKTKSKSKAKKEKERETRGRPKKARIETAETEDEASKKTNRPSRFVLKDEDYRYDQQYFCAHCDKTYDKFFSLRFHIKTKHYKIARFSCPYCKEQFFTPAPLTVHKLQEHNIDDRFKCKACKGAFNTKVQLRKHINNFHMLGERYKCEFCDYESFSFEGMYKHKFKHKTVKDYHCRFCRKAFLRKATLDLHERIHTGDRRKVCTVCGQAFVQKASLNYHMTKYHPEVNF